MSSVSGSPSAFTYPTLLKLPFWVGFLEHSFLLENLCSPFAFCSIAKTSCSCIPNIILSILILQTSQPCWYALFLCTSLYTKQALMPLLVPHIHILQGNAPDGCFTKLDYRLQVINLLPITLTRSSLMELHFQPHLDQFKLFLDSLDSCLYLYFFFQAFPLCKSPWRH